MHVFTVFGVRTVVVSIGEQLLEYVELVAKREILFFLGKRI
jgi:hypothetical protein